jgi:hypothetical protein
MNKKAIMWTVLIEQADPWPTDRKAPSIQRTQHFSDLKHLPWLFTLFWHEFPKRGTHFPRRRPEDHLAARQQRAVLHRGCQDRELLRDVQRRCELGWLGL